VVAEEGAAERTAAFVGLLGRINDRFLIDVPGVSEVWLIRHADAYTGLRALEAGPLDPPLSPEGRRQAQLLAARLRDVPVHRLWSSDLRRARETAEVVGRAKGLVVRSDPRLREVRTHWDEGAAPHPPPPGQYPFLEPEAEVLERMRAVMADVLADLAATGVELPRAAVVTHNAAIVIYVSSLMGLGWAQLAVMPQFTSVTVLAFKDDRTVVRSIGDATHLAVVPD
jgi:probable phosphoglycerate mutase